MIKYMLMFRSKFMIQCLIHQESCYLMIFCISQGSVVTHLRGGGKYDEPCYKFNTESNSERTFFLNRSTFSQTYKRRSSGTFLRPTVYGPVMLSFRDMTTGRTTGRTDQRWQASHFWPKANQRENLQCEAQQAHPPLEVEHFGPYLK